MKQRNQKWDITVYSKQKNYMWIKIQQMQQYADIYLLQSYSTCFGCPDQTTLEGGSGTSSMTCTGGCGYSS